MNKWRKWRLITFAILFLPVTLLVLFALNGLVLCDGPTARLGVAMSLVPPAPKTSEPVTPVPDETPAPIPARYLPLSAAVDYSAPAMADTRVVDKPIARGPGQVRVLSLNIAKGDIYKGGVSFDSDQAVRARLDVLAALIREADPDIVCLSEVVRECGSRDMDQTVYLAERSGLPNWAFGEYVSFGLPFYRMVIGTAILSRYPLHDAENLDLIGRKPFYITKNSRRATSAIADLPGGPIRIWSLHLDSFDFETNRLQMQQILDNPGSSPAIMGGDFNAQPSSATLALVADSGRFNGVIDSPPTFPSNLPSRAIDYVFAPAHWALVQHRVIATRASDHCAVMAIFARTTAAPAALPDPVAAVPEVGAVVPGSSADTTPPPLQAESAAPAPVAVPER